MPYVDYVSGWRALAMLLFLHFDHVEGVGDLTSYSRKLLHQKNTASARSTHDSLSTDFYIQLFVSGLTWT